MQGRFHHPLSSLNSQTCCGAGGCLENSLRAPNAVRKAQGDCVLMHSDR